MISAEQLMDVDFENLKSAISIAGDAGQATGNIAKGLSALQGLFKTSEAGSDAKIKLALSELTLQIAHAQVSNADLKLKLSALQDELRDAQAFKSDLDRYVLWEAPAGSLVYRLEKEIRDGEPAHFLCPNCVEEKRKSILQGHRSYRECLRCGKGFLFEHTKPPTRRVRGRSNWG